MLTALISPAVGILVSASTGIAIEKAASIIIPPTARAITGFAIKVGVSIGSGLIGAKIGALVSERIDSIIETVKNNGADVTTQEDI